MSSVERSYVRDEGGRGPEDMAAMEAARSSGECPFCQIIAGENATQPVAYKTAHWAVFHNIRPEDGAGLHLVVAAKIPRGHAPDFTFHSLNPDAIREFGSVIQDLPGIFGVEKGYSVVMRVGTNGDDNALTVFHPCFHLLVSDSQPVQKDTLNPELYGFIYDHEAEIIKAFSIGEPELYRNALDGDGGQMWVEALKYLWSNTALVRSSITGRAVEIRPKLSNLATGPQLGMPATPAAK